MEPLQVAATADAASATDLLAATAAATAPAAAAASWSPAPKAASLFFDVWLLDVV